MHLPEVFSQHNFQCLRFMQLLPTIGSTHSNLTLPSPSFTVPAAGAPTGPRRRAMAAPRRRHCRPRCPWSPSAAAARCCRDCGCRRPPPLLGRAAAPWPPPAAAASPCPPRDAVPGRGGAMATARRRPRPPPRHGRCSAPPSGHRRALTRPRAPPCLAPPFGRRRRRVQHFKFII